VKDWRVALLDTLGYRATPQNLRFLETWQRWEGGHTNNSATWNWLNTTHGDGTPINSVGVKAFPSFQAGITNTAHTLMNGRYKDILDALATGNPYTANPAAGLQVWVSGSPTGNPGYAQKILGGHVAQQPVTRAATKVREVKKTFKSLPPNPNTAWDTAVKMIFDDDPEMSHLMAGMDDKIAQESGLVSPGGSIKPVPLVDATGYPLQGHPLKVIKVAQTQLGKPYVFGSGPSTESFDCSDLIQWAYKQCGIYLPRDTYHQIKVGRSVKGKSLQPGDLIFPTTHHVVMYVGHGKVIAAPHTGTVVQYQDVPSNIVDVRRVIK
jgi:cell wall-associated NlpC family hydrolase